MRLSILALGTCIGLTATLAHAEEETLGEEASSESEGASDESLSAATEEQEPDSKHKAAEAAGSSADAPLTSEAGGDGGRFRFGVALGAGPLSTDGLSLMYYGVDLRFGWQLNDALAVYAQPQLGYYQLDGASALFGSGGLIGTSVLVDYTLFDRLFLGGGVGYAILNSPSGAELHLRAGGYPLVSRSDVKVRRRGLMLGVDFRLHFVEGYTFVAPTFNIGYDAF